MAATILTVGAGEKLRDERMQRAKALGRARRGGGNTLLDQHAELGDQLRLIVLVILARYRAYTAESLLASPAIGTVVAVLTSLQADAPLPDPCPASRSAHRLRSDPGDGGRPTPWGHCDAVLHRAPAPPSGPGGQVLRASTGPPAWTDADVRSAAPRRVARSALRLAYGEPARLQVFRC